jgi:large conductance mechanosensitive channel
MATDKPSGFLPGLLFEFKQFALQGNALDLAVGVVIGAAFGGIVNSLVKDIIMPPIGLITGGVDFSQKFIKLHDAVIGPDGKTVVQPENDWRYGLFINNIINFLIVAVSIFAVIKLISMMKKKQPAPPAAPPPPPEPTAEEKLLTEIRDAIKAKSAPIT